MMGGEQNPDIFDAAHWARPLSAREERRIAATLELIPEDVYSILDLGSGDGRVIQALLAKKDAKRIFALDYSMEGLRKIPVSSVRGSCADLPFGNNTFDCVICSEVLEHLTAEMTEQTISEMKRVTRKYLYITVPNEECLEYSSAKCPSCNFVFNIWGHIQQFDVKTIKLLFKDYEIKSYGIIEKRLNRDYSRFLHSLKQNVFNCWAWTDSMICPKCKNVTFIKNDRRMLRVIFGAINLLLNPIKSKGGWIYLVAECSNH